MKKIFSILICVTLLFLTSLDFFTSKAYAQVDTTPPELVSIQMSKQVVEAGDKIELTVETADPGGSGVDVVRVYYTSPLTHKMKNIPMAKASENVYKGNSTLTENDESGEWVMYYITIIDKLGNTTLIFNSENPEASWGSGDQVDLSEYNFELTGTQADITPPELVDIQLSKQVMEAGERDKIELTIETADPGGSGVDVVRVYYSSPVTSKNKYIQMAKASENVYKGNITLTENEEPGEWLMYYITIKDKSGNLTAIYNSKNPEASWGSGNQVDLSEYNFEMKEYKEKYIEESDYIISLNNMVWSNKRIEKDLYVGPNSTLTINDNVIITGNVYVYGTLVSDGGLTIQGTLNARSVKYGRVSTLLNQGVVYFRSGSNSIPSTSVTNQSYDVPVKIYNEELTNKNAFIKIEGKTLPFLDVTVQGQPVSLETDGTFSATVEDLSSGSIEINLKDIFGNSTKKLFEITDVLSPPAIEVVNKVTHHSSRVIGTAEAASKITVKVGTKSIGTVTADAKGNYAVTIAKQKIGTKLSVTATDAAGNSSNPVEVTGVDGNYPDLKLTHWALDEIMYLADDQIIGGYPNGKFDPEKNTTRAEAAKMLVMALGLPVPSVSSSYKDVSNKHWAKDYIAAASKAGLFNGNPDGTFAPDKILKRSEMAKIISIAYEFKASDANYFKDVKSGYWAKGYISGLYENGITTGYQDKTFRAEQPTTRAEFSVFLARALNADFR